MGLIGILLGLALMMWLAYRGWSVLLVAPVAALLAAAISGEPLLAHWTQTFMGGAASIRRAVVSDVSAWRVVRQADGRQRFDHLHRAFPDRTVGNTPHDALGGARLGRGHLWRRQRLCCLFRAGTHGAGDVPGREHPAVA